MHNTEKTVYNIRFVILCTRNLNERGKSKVHPRAGREGPVGEKRCSSTVSLTWALDGVDAQRHAPGALFSGKRACTHCTGVCVGSRDALDGCGKSCPSDRQTRNQLL